jgi:hypothetical protein
MRVLNVSLHKDNFSPLPTYLYYFLMLYILGFVENHKSHVGSPYRDLNSKNHHKTVVTGSVVYLNG